ncbi:ABC transporter permease [Roseicitreum antarcticum]|uniref:Peptide/nickel transport system permease protein n=1 Tax=Roseicitreum antarcticum TaxID=564137 RepID=A0A1H3AT31_9RHOB|nr:ABC transporter permease [Roseicitreum antarcticum]SDX32836.1 peptide/nickel transport system permease protein [Roseicitreum antarcticum]
MTPAAPLEVTSPARRRSALRENLALALRDPVTALCLFILAGFIAMALFAPLIAGDPVLIDPANRLRPPSADAIWGTDHLGRDVFARAVHGSRISLTVAFCVALISAVPGVAIGIYAGLSHIGGAVVMRLNDAMMAIPAVLLAIALAALLDAGLMTVIIAISVPEIPRMVRLVRSLVLGIRQQPYVDAAISIGTSGLALIWRHILPNTMAPVLVQATYAAASAIIASAVLSFLGVGTSPEVPSWGGMMADARTHFRIHPMLMFYPGAMLSILVLVVNILGDRLSDALDPRKVARGGL